MVTEQGVNVNVKLGPAPAMNFSIKLTQKGMIDAVEFWMNRVVLRQPCKVLKMSETRINELSEFDVLIEPLSIPPMPWPMPYNLRTPPDPAGSGEGMRGEGTRNPVPSGSSKKPSTDCV